MAIIETEHLNQTQFIGKFTSRSEMIAEQFSVRALECLYLYLEEMTDSTGEDIELDVVAICVEWAEYDSLEECLADYSKTFTKDMYGYDEKTTIEKLREHTTVLEIEDSKGIVIKQF
tara:strand:+ start:1158 stop:1508 length:351 start_codon:yes stop_codon:yes gene_type:complete